MLPFCCVPTINNHRESSTFQMPPPPVAASSESTRSADSPNHSASHNWCATNSNHYGSLTESSSAILTSLSRPASMREAIHLTSAGDQVKINDIVGNGISGILYKWVNYGKGWRPRWFVLQDGVLSYYKIHGPDRIDVNLETEKGSKVIGEESVRRISRTRPPNKTSQPRREPVGEVHLKVSSIRESRSDDRRFSIFTGTKRLHLRAETREDRMVWMEALQAVKDMFPRISNSELMAPVDNVVVSTDKLRQWLLKEGVSEAVIQDSEQIMKNEFASLQNQLMLLKQKHWLLMDTLRQLETEKVDLENTVVDESQRQLKEAGPSSRLRQDKYSEASASESEDENERVDAAEEDTDEEENTFFDTRDFLSSSSFKSSNGSDLRTSSFSSDDDDLYAYASDESVDPVIRSAGSKFPYVKRRKKLPNPIEKEKGVSLWSMIKDNIGKDLTKVCLPVYFNEPLSSLQKSFEDLEYSYLLDRASEWGKRVSHHPMIIACHCEGTGWKFWGDSNLKSKFWGRSIQLDPVGILTLEFDDGEVFQWSKVTTSIYNLILGKLYCDHYGTMRIQGNHNYSCKLKFKEQSIIDRNPHQVQGIVQDRSGKTVATLFGKWDESVHYVNEDCTIGKGFDSLSESAHLLWKRGKPPKNPTRYNLTRFAITMNELIPGLKEKLPPTDSRLRPDQRCLENGEYDKANAEKLRLEERQRQARKMQERGWKPQWFAKDKRCDTYRYIGGYWEARDHAKWDTCPDIFGHISSDQML